MKKSKLLMPLTGIAAIGAFAPVVAMTACHSSYEIVKSAVCGNVIDAETKLMTNRLGSETLLQTATQPKASVKLSIGATLTKKVSEIERGHIIKRTVHAAGAKGATGTPFLIESDVTTIIDGENPSEEIYFSEDAVTLSINSAKMTTLLEEEAKEESFSFVVTYEEFDSDETTAKSVGKQDYTMTVVACPKLHDCSTITVVTGGLYSEAQINVTGTVGVPEVTMNTQELQLKYAAASKLEIAFKNELVVKDLSDTEEEWKNATLTFAAGAKTTVEAEATMFGGFEGKLSQNAGQQWLTQVSYFAPEKDKAFNITFTVKAEDNTYVLNNWESTITTLKYDATQGSGGIAVKNWA